MWAKILSKELEAAASNKGSTVSQSNMETEINDAREQLWHLWFSMPSWWEQRNSSASHFRGDNLPKSIFGAMMNLIILVKWLLFGIFESRRPVCNTSSKLFKFFFSFKKSPKMDFGGVMVTSLLSNLKCHFFFKFPKMAQLRSNLAKPSKSTKCSSIN